MRIAVGSDHAGFLLKQEVAESLRKEGYDVVDVGTDSTAPVDYPDYAEKIDLAVKAGGEERAVLIWGSGVRPVRPPTRSRASAPPSATTLLRPPGVDDMNVLVLAGASSGPPRPRAGGSL
jgi:ribose 5-phosphate isomerase B